MIDWKKHKQLRHIVSILDSAHFSQNKRDSISYYDTQKCYDTIDKKVPLFIECKIIK